MVSPEAKMTELEQASINFFTAILKTGRDILGHDEFMFKLDAMVGSRPDDAERAKLIGARIQDALDVAKVHARPLTIEGTTVQ
jgi:hypothetical protein